MKRLLPVAILLAVTGLAGCTRSTEAQGKQSPEEVARIFMKAAKSGDTEKFMSVLTEAGRKGFESGSSSLNANRIESFEIGAVEREAQEAAVAVTAMERGKEKQLRILMRVENGDWRVRGMRLEMAPGQEFTLDFESMGKLAETIADSVGNEMKKAFEEAMRKQEEAKLERERAGFRALRAFDVSQLKESWTNCQDWRGKTVGEALRALAGQLGLELEADSTADLDAEVSVDVAGLSNLEAIDRLAGEIGRYAVFPTLQSQSGNDAPLELVLRQGRRPWPCDYTGPFQVRVDGVVENVPHATGKIQLVTLGYGVDPGVLTLLGDLGETIVLDTVVDAQGRELSEPGMRYFGGDLVHGNAVQDTLHLSLRNLLRSVDHIPAITGKRRILVPTEVHEVEFASLRPGVSKTVAGLTVSLLESGGDTTTQFDLVADEASDVAIDKLEVRFWPQDAHGEDVGIDFQSTDHWRKATTRASLQTRQKPARVRLKIITRSEVLEFPFRLENIELERHEEMPEALAELDFGDSDQPVSVEFLEFASRSEQNPEARFRLTNLSNKAARTLRVQFEYLDEQGNVLKEFPHTFAGTYSSTGASAAVESGQTVEQKSTAFFMPANTRRIRPVVEAVEFVDGTSWEKPRK